MLKISTNNGEATVINPSIQLNIHNHNTNILNKLNLSDQNSKSRNKEIDVKRNITEIVNKNVNTKIEDLKQNVGFNKFNRKTTNSVDLQKEMQRVTRIEERNKEINEVNTKDVSNNNFLKEEAHKINEYTTYTTSTK